MLQSYIVALLQKQLSFIYSILLANPLYRHGWQELCPWCNTPLAQLLTLLLHPAMEGAVTHSGGSRHLTFQVTFHLSFLLGFSMQRYKKTSDYARKYFTNFARKLSKIVKDCQCLSLSAKDCQRLTFSSYLCNVKERGNQQIENPESAR